MQNLAIEATLEQDPFQRPRKNTDALFTLSAGSFDYSGVFDEAARFIEREQLLDVPLFEKFVRVFSEIPKPDTANLGWRGEYWGKAVRGGCITYAYTQNAELRAALIKTVNDLIAVAEPDGRISAYDRETEFDGWDVWSRKYILLGFEYFLEYCAPDEALAAKVKDALCKEADLILAGIGKAPGQKAITKTARLWAGVASSSVLEPIMRLYFLTGEQKYLDFATYIVESGGSCVQNIFESAYRDETPPSAYRVIKAYEIISCFEGLIEYYRATGIEKWRIAALNLGKRIREEEISIIGTAGCWHELFDHSSTRQLATTYADIIQETCVSVTYLKFSLQLLCLSGNAAIGDEIERTAYNALLGAVNFEKKEEILPFDSYSPLVHSTRGRGVAGRQYFSDGSHYSCCACIGAAGTGLVPMASALLSESGIALNLYLPGRIAAKTPCGKPLELEIKTDYPKNGAILVEIATRDESPFTLSLRIPAWSYRTLLAVNGERMDVTPGTFCEITRVWKYGDRVEIWFDMRTEILTPPEGVLPDENAKYHVALRRGPLVLARDSRLPGDLKAPVNFRETEAGFADVRPAKLPPFRAFYAFTAMNKDGSEVSLLDYASAGHTFDCNSIVSAWMPTKNYYAADVTKPFRLRPCSRNRDNIPNVETRGKLRMKDGVLCTANYGVEAVITPVPAENGMICFKVGDRFLATDEEGRLVLAEKGTPVKPVWEGLCRYHFEFADGRRLLYLRKNTEQPVGASTDMTHPPLTLFEVVN